ncbi:ATP-dependent DNA ligase [Microcella flavibacter]|uniref:ATP-dependent DNA ligase n=1 Tax=Microcella flavibacter TaxID=1804990 RepID=UPI0014565D53|nr:ATP-dependent DNA ligase [Microcella flavibacter]
MPGSRARPVTIDGRRLALTNLDKVLYPETGTTKAEVLEYIATIAPVMLPHLRGRPVTRKRWVDGVGTAEHPGAVFFQKKLDASTPEWIERAVLPQRTGDAVYALLQEPAALAWAAQTAALELHVPQWRLDADGRPGNPDRLVLDLDPGPGTGLAECAEIARRAREYLRGAGLDPVPVTSGSKGIHLYSALDGERTSEEVSAVAHELARALEADLPELVVSRMAKTLREGRVLVDWSQNSAAKTTIAPYSLRGTLRPFVAAPRSWAELDEPGLAQLTFTEVLERVARDGDLLAGLRPGGAGSGDAGTGDRLATYRSMRDARRTPEPVPSIPPPRTDGRRFVIQEHHARSWHLDFRLEHEGVLVSWALPRGVPTDPAANRLAVPTEDHPLEYASFAGTIPKGEYGAGEVTIWDAGTYELEKWRDGEEVIVVLHGGRGVRRYALIRTGENWIIHLMDEGAATAPPSGLPPRRSGRRVLGGSARTGRAADDADAPMLATRHDPAAGDEDGPAGEGGGWAMEMKWDGIRAIATVAGGALELRSRNGIDLTASYPELAVLVDRVEGSVRDGGPVVLDGEIVALDAEGRPDFSLLQRRMGATKPKDVALARRAVPVQLLLFDVLTAGGERVVALPYDDRRALLEQLVASGGAVSVPPSVGTSLDEAMATSLELGLEGVVAKWRASPYRPGRRSPDWVKLRHERAQEVVVGGWRAGEGERRDDLGALLLGVPGPEGLRYVGRVGTGFSAAERRRILAALEPLAASPSPFLDVPAEDAAGAHWVRPERVAEVSLTGWTGGDRLRHAVWRGWRPDKRPGDVVRE